MNSLPGTSPGCDFVNFNGLRVEKSAIPLLVEALVECDPLNIPSGDQLQPSRRDAVCSLFRSSFLEEHSQPSLLAALGGDRESLCYLAGLMASRY